MSESSRNKSITVRIPNYITEVKVSNSRRAKNFKEGNKVPDKYLTSRYVWKNSRLFDTETKLYVVKNPIAVGTPRYQSIAGNEIYARMHERVRMVIVKAIKEDYAPHMPDKLDLKYPIALSMNIFTHPKYLNWDVDNLWIYIKCFQDLLKDRGLIIDDDIRYIKSSGQINFHPLIGDAEPALEFNLVELNKPSHVMYNLEPKEFIFRNILMHNSLYNLTRTKDGNLGDVIANIDEKTFYLNVGKLKVSEKAVTKALIKVFHHCIHYNIDSVSISEPFYLHFKDHLTKELLNRGIEVRVYKSTL